MNHRQVSDILDQVLDPSSPEHQAAVQSASKLSPELYEIFLDHYLGQAVATVLATQPEFPDGEGVLINYPDGAVGLHAQQAAVALIKLARDSGDAVAAVAWLDRTLRIQKATGISVMALWGVTVKQPVELSPNVSLVPMELLPDSEPKQWLLQPSEFPGVAYLRHQDLAPPNVVLTTRVEIDPVFRKGNERSTLLNPSRGLLSEVALALTAVGPSAPLSAALWFQFDDADLQRAMSDRGVTGSLHEVMPWMPNSDVELDPQLATRVVTSFLESTGPARDRLRIGLQRLNLGLRRYAPADKCLELAIALESVLTDGSGENTYKVGLRTGLLTKGEAGLRIRNRALASALYSLRSAVAHDGVVPADCKLRGRGRVPSTQVIEEAVGIVAMVLRELIFLKELPDWYNLELGG